MPCGPARVILVFLVMALTGCQSPYRLATGKDTLGVINTKDLGPERQVGGVMPACRTGSAAAQRSVDRTRTVIDSWYEVMRHLERCDLSRLRYYSQPRFEVELRAPVQRLAAQNTGACRAEAVDTDERLKRLFVDLREWVANSLPYCGAPLLREGMHRTGANLLLRGQTFDCWMRREFAGLGVDVPRLCNR